ncbi:hypothetical protein ABK040_007735 [Willaertia magna]
MYITNNNIISESEFLRVRPNLYLKYSDQRRFLATYGITYKDGFNLGIRTVFEVVQESYTTYSGIIIPIYDTNNKYCAVQHLRSPNKYDYTIYKSHQYLEEEKNVVSFNNMFTDNNYLQDVYFIEGILPAIDVNIRLRSTTFGCSGETFYHSFNHLQLMLADFHISNRCDDKCAFIIPTAVTNASVYNVKYYLKLYNYLSQIFESVRFIWWEQKLWSDCSTRTIKPTFSTLRDCDLFNWLYLTDEEYVKALDHLDKEREIIFAL